jgi:hypothetical protein
LLTEGNAAKAVGLDPDQARAAIAPRLAGIRDRITQDDATFNDAFDVQMVDWFMHRVYEELDGPLSDAIAPIPVKL